RYGIPEFKMEKQVVDRRLTQLEAEGIEFRCGVSIGLHDHDEAGEPGQRRGTGTANALELTTISLASLEEDFDAVVLACGSTRPRDLAIAGREFEGVHLALEYLKPANLVQDGSLATYPIDADGKRVVIIGGGDTGADCLGTAHRQGAVEVLQLEIMDEPPDDRSVDNPWPQWPVVLRSSSAHEEGGERLYAVETVRILDDGEGKVVGIEAQHVTREFIDGQLRFSPVPDSTFTIPCELVLLASRLTVNGKVLARASLSAGI
ncbi:MAG: FAD-dependent oxidoreductase, partial [Actinobacteria bacterium]|nr:FAD-dependent oxidoreductase [Actinomycetota bacterium]